ncbi:MAG: hypothetical protein JJLCMIEE_01595 [Acidimicrobiales bacterium]|nr:hypothetical protein [Acidimicrobiales bacterium]
MNQAHTTVYRELPLVVPHPQRRVPRWGWALAVVAFAAGAALAVAAVEYDEVVREWLSLAGASEAGAGEDTSAGESTAVTTAEPTDAANGPVGLDTEEEVESGPTEQEGADSSTVTDTAQPDDSGASPESASPSSPSTDVAVPNLNGTGRAEAEQTLWDLGLSPVSEFASDGGSPGVVIGCDVCGTSVQPLSTVVLTVSAEPAPDVHGLSEAIASSTITSAGLSPYAVYGPSPTVPAGNVYDQSPVGSVPQDGVVMIWVSTGP